MKILKDEPRKIIESFEKEINERKSKGPKPQTHVINFRNEQIQGKERPVYFVPINLLRYRKDNGRIADDVLSYELTHEKLDETTEETQAILRKFLKDKDDENFNILRKSIQKDGQTEPAIITCDGFLINGNRRKMVFEDLYSEDPKRYSVMKVVILPSKKDIDEGGEPTLKEIELIENRYQLQKEGKSEYSGLNRALSTKRKIEVGITLEEQLRDDPINFGISDKEMKKAKEKYIKEYLHPLECADRYLDQIGRPGYYNSISDKDGRWQAFIDYSDFRYGKLIDTKWQIEKGVNEDEIGDIEDIAFKIIRKRKIDNVSKRLNDIMRDLDDLLAVPDAKRCLYDIGKNVSHNIADKDKYDKDGNEKTLDDIDKLWGENNNQIFMHKVKLAYEHYREQSEIDTPLGLLEGAYRKLTHKLMIVENIPIENLKKFVLLAEKVRDRVEELKDEAWPILKDSKGKQNENNHSGK
jgi:hypothetical protein